MLRWTAKKAGTGYFRAAAVLLRLSALTTIHEKTMTFRVQRVFRKMPDPDAFVSTAPEQQPYRKEPEIRSLFKRLRIPVKRLDSYATCHIVAI